MAQGARRAELRRAGQQFFQLARAGQWCVVDTAGRQRLPLQPDSRELLDFQPATGLAIVRRGPLRGFVSQDDPVRYTYVGPAGLVGDWLYSSLVSWGPTELLGELVQPAAGPRYQAIGARGQVRRRLAYAWQVRYPEAGLALLGRPNDPQAGTLVLDLVAGGVRQQLPSAWAGAEPYAADGSREAAHRGSGPAARNRGPPGTSQRAAPRRLVATAHQRPRRKQLPAAAGLPRPHRAALLARVSCVPSGTRPHVPWSNQQAHFLRLHQAGRAHLGQAQGADFAH